MEFKELFASPLGLVPFIVGLIVLNLFVRIMKYGGIKNALYGATIVRKLGVVHGKKHKLMSLKINVHELRGEDGEPMVGLEIVGKSFASYKITPIALSAENAQRLTKLISRTDPKN